LVRVSVAAATVGGLCYVFKDKIKDSKVYKDYDVDTKLSKDNTTIKEKMPKVFDNEEDYVEDDEIFFEDEEFNPENASRDYVSINLDSTPEDSEAEAKPEDNVSDAAEAAEADVPTIEV
jgi:hypothetical protein